MKFLRLFSSVLLALVVLVLLFSWLAYMFDLSDRRIDVIYLEKGSRESAAEDE